VDAQLRLVAWNRRYAILFDYPRALLQVGVPIEELVRYNVARGLGGEGTVEQQVERRLRHMRAGTPYVAERRFPDRAARGHSGLDEHACTGAPCDHPGCG